MRVAFRGVVISALLLLAAVTAAGQSYEVVDLGANVYPTAMNRQGVVVGDTWVSPTTFWPFIWQNGSLALVQGNGWTGGAMLAINASGVAAGQALLATGGTAPFTYDGGTITPIPIGTAAGSASAINDNGIIGGFIQQRTPSGFFGSTTPYLFLNGSLNVLQGWGAGGGVNSINGAGVAVGNVYDGIITSGAVWAPPSYALQPLAPIGGNSSDASAINDQGVIAGISSVTGSSAMHAAIWQNNQPIDIGAVPGTVSTRAMGINNSGQVVGTGSGGGVTAAFLYANGQMKTLNELAGASTGWQFSVAEAINDAGDIAGYGYPPSASQPHGFILRTVQLTPSQMIASMIARIDGYALNAGIAQSLEAKLLAVRDSLDRSGPSACNQLSAFVNEVDALDGNQLTSAQANALRSAAATLTAALHC